MLVKSLKDTTDYSPLETEVTAEDIAAFRANKGVNPGSAWIAAIVIFAFMSGIFFIYLVIAFIVLVIDSLVSGNLFGGISGSDAENLSVPLICSLAFAVPIFPLYFLNRGASRRNMAVVIRYHRFAKANGWTYSDWPKKPLSYSGIVFNAGIERRTTDMVRSQGGVDFVYGTQHFVTGVGKGRSSNEFGFIALTTSQDLPHVVLDSKANNGQVFKKELFTNLPIQFDSDQETSISPEVDALYRTYTLDNNSAAVSQIITPEFIAKLKALGSGFHTYDIEIKGHDIFIYSPYAFKRTKEGAMTVMTLIDLFTEAFEVTVNADFEQPSILETNVTDGKKPALKGKVPTYVKVLGTAAVIIQFIALIGYIISRNQ